ncbi:hypothetical protein V2J09_005182 [Rumex salicifolius]
MASAMEVPDDAGSEQQNITSEATSDQDSSSASSKENKDSAENIDINTSEASSDQDLGSSNEKRILKEDILISTMEVPDDAHSKQQNITSEATSDQDSSSASSNENKDSAENIDIAVNKNTSEVPSVQDSDSSNAKRILKEDILIVQSLIEQCMHTYMSRREVVQTLQNRDSIDPWFTTLVWQELEKQNAEYFKAYCTGMKIIELINKFNSLLKKQCETMKDPANPIAQITPQQANKVPDPLTLTFGTTSLDVAYKSEASTSAGHPRENLRHLAHIPRAFGFTNLVSDSTNFEDLGPLGNYFGSPYLPSFRPVQSDEVNTEAKDQVPPETMQDPSNSQ